GGGKEVRIDPANPAPVQSSIAHKFYDISMRHHRCLVHSLVVGQQLSAAPLSPMSSSPKTKSWPLTSSRLKSPSSSPAYGARLDRNRIQTDVSTKTIMPLRDRRVKPAHVAGQSHVRVVRIRGARATARTRRGELAPRDQDEPCQCLSSH